MSDQTYDCLIVGGGISGISFAHYLSQQGKKVLVVEKNDRLGGQVQSPLAQVDKHYWRELGAHTCYNSYTHLLSIVNDLDAREHVQALGKGGYKIFANGEVKSITTQIAFPSLMMNSVKVFWGKREGKTVKQYFQNIVGKKNYEHLFTRLFRAVLSQDTDQYPAEIFLKRRDGRFNDFPRKVTFAKGLHTIIDLMVEKNKIEIVNNSEVQAVAHNTQTALYTLTTANQKTYHANNIAFACDPQTTSRLVKELEPGLAGVLETIPMFHSQSMNIIADKHTIGLKSIAGIIPVSDEFHSAVSRDLVEDEQLRSFTFHFPDGEKTYNEKKKLICNVLKIQQSDLLEIAEDNHILPSLRLAHLHMAEQVAGATSRKSMYILGNYFYGLSLEDCVHRSLDESRRLVLNGR